MQSKADLGVEYLDRVEGIDLADPGEFWEELGDLYEKGLPPGSSTGWQEIDEHYTVAQGQWTLITGWPGSGKSEWLDCLMINLMKQDWRFVVYSPENQPHEVHLSKLVEKIIGKPFGEGLANRMTLSEVNQATTYLRERLRFVKTPHGDPIQIDTLVETIKMRSLGLGADKLGVIIDPWNELEHWRRKNQSETEYVSHALSYLRGWCREDGLHVFLVAHPRKLGKEDGELPIPGPYDVSGSAHFWNKADNAITIHRQENDGVDSRVMVVVKKIRFKHIGRRGTIFLRYEPATGTYSAINWRTQ